MVTVTITGIIILLIDIILLYYLRDENGDKILQMWMIVLAIMLAPVPILGVLGGGLTLIIIIAAIVTDVVYFPYNSKLSKWLTKKI